MDKKKLTEWQKLKGTDAWRVEVARVQRGWGAEEEVTEQDFNQAVEDAGNVLIGG